MFCSAGAAKRTKRESVTYQLPQPGSSLDVNIDFSDKIGLHELADNSGISNKVDWPLRQSARTSERSFLGWR
jgi:hypothetical protein